MKVTNTICPACGVVKHPDKWTPAPWIQTISGILRTAEELESGGVTCEKCREVLRRAGYPAYQEQETPRPPAAGVGRMLRELASDYRAKPRCTPPTTETLLAAADEMARTFRLVCAWNTPDCGGDCHDTKPAPLFVAALARYKQLRGIK